MAQRRRLVVVQAEVDAELHLAHRVGERQIGRRGVDRIAADDDEQIDLAGVHVGDEIAQRRELIDRLGFDRVGVDDRLADVAERLVHRVRERVDDRRLAVAGDDEARSAVRLQILGDRGDPFDASAARRRAARTAAPHRRRSRRRSARATRFDLARLQRQPMIGARAGRGRHALDRVEPVHALGVFRAPPRGEVARVAQAAGPARRGSRRRARG